MTGASANTMAGHADARVSLRPDGDALFLDFDGTLTEIVANPGDAVLTPARRALLAHLPARFGGAAAILSGRALPDLDMRVPDRFWRVGGHGDEIAAPGPAPAPASGAGPHPRLLAAAQDAVRRFPGVSCEVKSDGVALHYRANPNAGTACAALLDSALRDAPGYAIQGGKMVVEARPLHADKGRALHDLMRRPPFAGRRPVMIGDDLTDEAAMRAALRMGGIAVKVGPGPSVAGVRLAGPAAVYEWLASA